MRDLREKVVNTFLGDIDCIATDDNAEEFDKNKIQKNVKRN